MTEQTPFQKSLQKIKIHFSLSGLSLESRKKTRIQRLKSRCLYIFNFIWMNSDVIVAMFWFSDGFKNGKDVTELTYLAPCTALSFLSTFKSLLHIKYEDHVNQLIEDLKELEKKRLNQNYEDTAKSDIKFLNLVVNVLNFLNGFMVIVFTFAPLVLIAVRYMRTKELVLMLPFLDIYPFDPLDIKYWPWVYIHQMWSECIVLFNICAPDFLFYTCCTYMRIQFKLLQQELEKIVQPCNTSTRNTVGYADVRSKFVEIVRWHQELISSAEKLEIIYTKSTLFNFLSSSIVICLTGFNVTTIDDAAFVLIFVNFLFMSLLQIYFLCLFGDLLMTSSVEVSDAVYKTKWYLCEISFRKNLQIVLTRAQKPCKLTANGYADVNLGAFMRVLSSAWSYFALLKTVYSSLRS